MTLAITASTSGQSKPTFAARLVSFSARAREGSTCGTSSRTDGTSVAFRGLVRALVFLDVVPARLGAAGVARRLLAEDVRMAADQLFGDRLHDVAEIEQAFLGRHLGVKHRLQQQIAEFLAQIVEIVALDGVGDLVGFLDRVVADRREILLEVPGAAAIGVAQGRHDFDEAGDFARGLQGSASMCGCGERRDSPLREAYASRTAGAAMAAR